VNGITTERLELTDPAARVVLEKDTRDDCSLALA